MQYNNEKLSQKTVAQRDCSFFIALIKHVLSLYITLLKHKLMSGKKD